jgi:signal transduction histidine kinase
MTPTAHQLLIASLYVFPLVVWGIVAGNARKLRRAGRPQRWSLILMGGLGAVMSVFYGLAIVLALVPPAVHAALPTWLVAGYVLTDVSVFVALAVFRHLARLLATRDVSPGGRWLALNYASSAAMCTLAAWYAVRIRAPGIEQRELVYQLVLLAYVVGMFASAGREMARFARPGLWKSGAGVDVMRRADVVLVTIGMGLVLVLIGMQVLGGAGEYPIAGWGIAVLLSLVLAIPIAMRILGQVVRGFVLAWIMILSAAAIYFGMRYLVAPHVGPELTLLVDVVTVLWIVVVLGPVQAMRRELLDRWVFRGRRRRNAELQGSVHTLSPELGTVECARRALGAVERDPRFREAAVVLRDGTALGSEGFPLAPVRRAWPRGAGLEALPPHSLGWHEFGLLPRALEDALVDAEVGTAVRIASPRGCWGHLLLSFRRLATFDEDDLDALDAFATELALVLDGADLLARTVAVERSLAHAEKLAAVGETAARIAHEIRNPVTAARSLAQQLMREPNGEHGAELGIILSELERVERQVAALLRFARREDIRPGPTDLGALVRGTVDAMRARLDDAGVTVTVDAAEAIVARADEERLRQVLVNLVENALDALDGVDGRREIALRVGRLDGRARLRIADTGPGVPPDALPHIFEPFFSLKANGTGLGLAIARRIVEAHGGHMEASSAPGAGLALDVDLPLERAEA